MTSGRLLVVDDEVEIAAMIEEHFVSLGYQVDVANDGAAALIQAAARRARRRPARHRPAGRVRRAVLDRLRAIDGHRRRRRRPLARPGS